MTRPLLAIVGLALIVAPAGAQELSVPDYQSQYAEALLHSRLTGRMVRQAHERDRNARASRTQRGPAISARSRATCRDKRRIAARVTPARAAQLYRLCAQAGY